jgi:hypothetical protein
MKKQLLAFLLLALLLFISAQTIDPCTTYDICGVCNGDSSTCDITGTDQVGESSVSQKSFCAIEQQVNADEPTNPLFTVRSIASKSDSQTTTFGFSCSSVEALARIQEASTINTVQVTDQTGDFLAYQTTVSLSDLYLCREAITANNKISVDFYVAMENSKDNTATYATACNYEVYRNDGDSAYSTSYSTQRFGFQPDIIQYTWDTEFAGTLKAKISTRINVIDGNNPTLSVNSIEDTLGNQPNQELLAEGDPVCSEFACTQIWILRKLAASNGRVLATPKITWLINPQNYAGLNGATVEATLHIDVAEPVNPDPIELPTPTSTLQLYSDSLHTHETRTFVHGLPIYGSVSLQDCVTYGLMVTKIDTVCANDESEWDDAIPHVVYNTNPIYNGGDTYDSLVVASQDCKSQTDFRYTARILSTGNKCRVGVHFKYYTGEEAPVLSVVRTATISFNTSETYSTLSVTCPSGKLFDVLKGDCVITRNGTKNTNVSVLGFVVVSIVLLLIVGACAFGFVIVSHHAVQKKPYTPISHVPRNHYGSMHHDPYKSL